jgi:hypothetical protein
MTSTVSGGNLDNLSADPYNPPVYIPVPPVTVPVVQQDEALVLQKMSDVMFMVNRIENMSDTKKQKIIQSMGQAISVVESHIGSRAVTQYRIEQRDQRK